MTEQRNAENPPGEDVRTSESSLDTLVNQEYLYYATFCQ